MFSLTCSKSPVKIHHTRWFKKNIFDRRITMAAVEYVKEGRIAIITINRPEALNAINGDVQRGVRTAYTDFAEDENLWVAILTGAGDRAFCAGADIKGFLSPASGGMDFKMTRADQVWKPIIAAIHGYCLGGGNELALECDIRIAAENAQFGQPEINIGYLAAGGGTQRLPRFIPRAVAADILLTGRFLNAQEALQWGLVSRVVPRDKLMETAREVANTICTRSPLSVRKTKEAMIKGFDKELDEGLGIERQAAGFVRSTEDFVEGARSFAQKRPPQWKVK
jgi:enoyl-CoA hydratase/carnithine racemase